MNGESSSRLGSVTERVCECEGGRRERERLPVSLFAIDLALLHTHDNWGGRWGSVAMAKIHDVRILIFLSPCYSQRQS